MATHHTWAAVRPKLEKNMDDFKTAMTTCKPEELVRLQERYAALADLRKWFEEGEVETDRLLGAEVEY
jgi:hypothetical protein